MIQLCQHVDFSDFSTYRLYLLWVAFVAIDGKTCDSEVNWCLRSIKAVFEVVKSVTLSSVEK